MKIAAIMPPVIAKATKRYITKRTVLTTVPDSRG